MKTVNAQTQVELSATDLALVLALQRGGTLAGAAQRLGVDASTVFRGLQRLERGLGEPLFARSRSGLAAMDRAKQLAGIAEQVESLVDQARGGVQKPAGQLSGCVRISTTDAVMHALLAPALAALRSAHPKLEFDLHTGNELANLTRRDADIALRATKRPPPHLVGKCLGAVRVAVYAAKSSAPKTYGLAQAANWDWIAPDEGLPEHPTVLWRKRHLPKLVPRYRVSGVLQVADLVAQGMGVGILPLFLAESRPELKRLSPALEDCASDLWLLTHAESRHLTRISTVFSHLSQRLQLP